MLIAYDWWRPSKFPFLNEAFLFSFVLSTVLAFLAIPYAKRRPKGTPISWGEAMLAAVYVFGTMFLAFGVVPAPVDRPLRRRPAVDEELHHLRPVSTS